MSAIQHPPPLDFGQLLRDLLINVGLVGPGQPCGDRIDDNLRRCAVDHRADAIFLLPRRTDLVHQQNIHRRAQRLGDLKSDRDTATR